MMTLDVEKWSKKERFADAYGMVSTCVALIVSVFGLLSVWAIDWPSSMIPVAMIFIAWMNLAWAWRRYCYCTDMLSLAKAIAVDDGRFERVVTRLAKFSIPAPKMKPPKCECVSPDFVILEPGFDGRCVGCGKPMRQYVWFPNPEEV